MTDTVRQTAARSASPRHMRKRTFRGDLPPRLLGNALVVPAPLVEKRPPAAEETPQPKPAPTRPTAARTQRRKATVRQKRLVALATVILVSISIPLLVLTLIFAG